jgi:hypothetical protein
VPAYLSAAQRLQQPLLKSIQGTIELRHLPDKIPRQIILLNFCCGSTGGISNTANINQGGGEAFIGGIFVGGGATPAGYFWRKKC